MENKYKLHYLYGEEVPPVLIVNAPSGFGGQSIIDKDNNGNQYIVGSVYPGPGLIYDPHWKVLDMSINDAKTGLPRHYSYFTISDKSVAIYVPDNNTYSMSYIYSSLLKNELNRIEQMRLDEGMLRIRQINEQKLKEEQENQKNKKKFLDYQKKNLKILQDEQKKLIQNKERTVRSLRKAYGDQAEAIFNQENETISKEIVMLTNSISINEKNIKNIDNDLKTIQDKIKNLKPAKTITKGKK